MAARVGRQLPTSLGPLSRSFRSWHWAWSKLIDQDVAFDEEVLPAGHPVAAAPADVEMCAPSGNPTAQQKPSEVSGSKRSLVTVTLSVDGICCPSEVPLVEMILQPIAGVEEIRINVVSKLVCVRYDPQLAAPADFVAALNGAALGARVQLRGSLPRQYAIPKRLVFAAMFWVVSGLGFVSRIYLVWRVSALLSLCLTVPKVLVRALEAARHCVLDMNALILFACAGAIAISSYSEAATVLFLFSTADYLEFWVTQHARKVIGEVLALRPEEAELVSGEKATVSDLPLGAEVVVRQGDAVPVDGVIISGTCVLNESALSGEAMPVSKSVGAEVWAGTTSISGYIVVRGTAAGKDSTIGKLVHLIEEAQSMRSVTENTIERFAKVYTPCVLCMAFLMMTIPRFAKPEVAPELFYQTLVLLVIACPCALVISTPVSYLSGIASAATHNILVRGGIHLETLGKVDVVAFDKTGTLTEAVFRLREFHLASAGDEELIWRWVAAVEAQSSHPVAVALAAAAAARGRGRSRGTCKVEAYREVPGEGVFAAVDNMSLAIGSESLAGRMGWTTEAPVEKWAADGGTVVWMGVEDGPLLATFSLADAPRPEARSVVATIASLGLSTLLLTGDGSRTATAVAQSMGIADVKSALKPDEKIDKVARLRTARHTVMMVGDGVNDVPALVASDVGVAMGAAGRAAALEAADVVLMDSDLKKLVIALRLGRLVLRKVRQNIVFAILSKMVMLTCAVMGYSSLWGAIAADVGAMLIVTLNGTSIMSLGNQRSHPTLSVEEEIPAPPAFMVPTCQASCCRAAAEKPPYPPQLTPEVVGKVVGDGAPEVTPEAECPPPPPQQLNGGFCASFSGKERRGRPPRPPRTISTDVPAF